MDTPELALYRKILQKENQLDFRFPEHLLGELRRFFSVHPLDDNFLIECAPNTFGVVTCLENACYSDHVLQASTSVPDGGKAEGCGSLRAYEEHIANTPGHIQARNERRRQFPQPAIKFLPPHAPRPIPQAPAPFVRAPRPNAPARQINGLGPDDIKNFDPRNGARPELKRFSSEEKLASKKRAKLDEEAQDELRDQMDQAWLAHQQSMAANVVAAQARDAVLQAQLAAQVLIHGVQDSDSDGELDRHDNLPVYSGNREDLDEFIKAAADSHDFEGNETVEGARDKLGLPLDDLTACIPGMVCTLMPHQVVGVAWLLEQENSKHYGGILADEMGLGKTVQAIALMAVNLSKDKKERTTLVVAPVALLEQWKDEIETKCTRGFFKVLIHHGNTRVKNAKQFQQYDVVITTYATLSLEWPDDESALKRAKAARKKAGEEETDEFDGKTTGPIFDFSWYRVILDEAQGIRNRGTRTSRSVSHLDALFRWCLTGTPVTNSLADLYALMRFCQIKPWYDWNEWRDAVMVYERKKPEMAGRRVQAILKTCLLRRKKDSTLDGKALITLPTKTVEVRSLEFSEEERQIYTFVQTKSQAKFNRFLAAGTVLKNYAHILVMLLRLRQICCHPALIAEGYGSLSIDEADVRSNVAELGRAEQMMGSAFVVKMQGIRREKAVERIELEKGDRNAAMDEEECVICYEPLGGGETGGAVVTRCGHAYCRVCITSVLDREQAEHDAEDPGAIKLKPDERPCPTCRQAISPAGLFALAAFEPSEAELLELTGVKEIEKGDDDAEDAGPVHFMKQKNARVVQDSDDEEEAVDANEKDVKNKKGKGKGKAIEEDNWSKAQEPSAKMRWLLVEIERVAATAPDEKFLVLCSFTKFLDILDDFLNANGVRTVRFQGDMSRKDRDQSLRIITKSTKVKVILMSLKCGGVGINLVRCSHVVNMDLAWSHSVEAQAFDRCHRIGQTRPVQVDRLTIVDSVDQRIAEMQERKQGLADASLGEGKGIKHAKMSVNELAMLFGITPR